MNASIAVLGAVLIVLLAIFLYKNRKTLPESGGKSGTAENSGRWLERWAYLPEFLSVALTLAWAYSAQRGAIMPFIFCGGFIAFVAFRAISIPRTIDSLSAGRYGTAAALGLLAIGSLVVLFGTSVFDLANHSDDEVQARIESSKPAEALDAEIAMIKSRIQNLAGFSDASKAHSDAQTAAAAAAAAKSERMELSNELKRQEIILSNCPRLWFKKCINPAEAEIARIQALLNDDGAIVSSSGYAAKYEEYSGLQNHLVTLEQKRAELSESGGGIQTAYRKEDRIIGDFLKIPYSDAASIKWLVFAAVFDLLALLARIGGAMLNPRDNRAIIRRKVNAMLDLGIDPLKALDTAQPATANPAQVQNSSPMPALHTGGRVLESGTCKVLKNEFMLTAAAADWVESEYPGWLDNLNKGIHEWPDASNDIFTPTHDTYKEIAGKPVQADRVVLQKSPSVFAGSQNLECKGKDTNTFWIRINGSSYCVKNEKLQFWKDLKDGESFCAEIIGNGICRVFNDTQSDDSDKGKRVKGEVYACSECGSDYTAKHKNHYRCTECSTAARQDYAKRKAGK